MANQNIAILGLGMTTAVGLDAKHTAASVRAGISQLTTTSIMDKHVEPMVMAILPDEVLPETVPDIEEAMPSRQTRMLRLAACALSEATRNLADIEQTALYLGIPRQDRDRPGAINHRFFKYLSLQSGVAFDIGGSMLFPMGRAAGLIALGKAIHTVASGISPYAIVGGVDTYVDLYRLGTLDMEGRIAGERVMDGFIPGEGAAFLVIGRVDQALSSQRSPLAGLTVVTQAHESGHMYSDQTYQGEGLAEAVSQFLTAGGVAEPIQEVFTSMNGENHWAKEWGVAHMRNQKDFSSDHGFHHPAECLGDTGAASGVIMISLAAIGLSKGYLKSPVLVICSSDRGERSAVGILPQ